MSARPQVGIERLPVRRLSNEPRESMNYAVPKKRGPKTDVLEALLKRVDGLEKRLKDEKKSDSPSNEGGSDGDKESPKSDSKPERPQIDTVNISCESAVYSPTPISEPSPMAVQPDVLLDAYFSRCDGKTYYILDESTTRQRMHLNQIPTYLIFAIYAVSSRYTAHPNGYHAAVRLSEDYAVRARSELDIDDPSIDSLQALLLLTVAFIAAGKGKKAHMMLSSGIGMAVALELHREIDLGIRVTPVEAEMRRRLFWTCYLMDRFMACGSRRPSLIADRCILLRLPSWAPGPAAPAIEGEFFKSGSNLQHYSGSGKKCQGSSGMLIDMVRILGITNRYLAAGGVKGDSHFPWHSLSNLSKIRQDLDTWASGTQDVFTSIDTLFGQADSTALVLSKLIYHLIHCLIYRPFLPVDLAELAGTGQHQSWQIEATNLCFLHANAIAELVELGKQSAAIEWPAFVGYCICTAGTVHVHGTHYKGSREGEVFAASADFLSREMQQLSELRYAWSSAQHQRDTLQTVYACHSELLKSLASSPLRYSPVFQLEDFFDRYADLQSQSFDGAHISLADILPNSLTQEQYTRHDLYNRPAASMHTTSPGATDPAYVASKRKQSSASRRKHFDLKLAHRNSHSSHPHPEATLMSPSGTLSGHPSDQTLSPHQHPLQHSMLDAPSTLSYAPFSPAYTFASLPPPSTHPDGGGGYDPMFGMPGLSLAYLEGRGPGTSLDGETTTPGGSTDDKDPFLSLLEQLAENEHSRGGPSELDFILGGAQS